MKRVSAGAEDVLDVADAGARGRKLTPIELARVADKINANQAGRFACDNFVALALRRAEQLKACLWSIWDVDGKLVFFCEEHLEAYEHDAAAEEAEDAHVN